MIYFVTMIAHEILNSPFYQYFSEIYGESRWPNLFESLRAPDKKVARLSPYQKTDLGTVQSILGQNYVSEDQALSAPTGSYYVVDLASLIPPLVLNPKPGESCLDMCAAPGGKSVVLASLLAPQDDLELEFVANEISQDRRSRLIRVLREQLPENIFRQIKITAHDAAKWCLYQKDYYDKILLDVPCSGERYFATNTKEIAGWTKKRTQTMGVRQFSILASAFESLKVGGTAVYSTCSISPLENDEVIHKLLKKRKDRVEILAIEGFEIGERTQLGYQILPDRSQGYGPIYLSKIKRLS